MTGPAEGLPQPAPTAAGTGAPLPPGPGEPGMGQPGMSGPDVGGLGNGPTEGSGRNRLHPLSPVLNGLRLLVLAVIAISWRGVEQLTLGRWFALVGGLMIVLLGYSTIAWRFTGYEVTRRELRIYEGLISRRVRTVPLERLQAIEVVQPFQAKPFGLAELKLDVAGTQKAEAPLAYLPLEQATALRAQLLSLTSNAETPEQEAEADAVFKVDNNDVIVSQLLTPPVLFTPVAIIYVVFQLFYNEDFSFFAIASMLTAVAATAFVPVKRSLNFWDFRLARTGDGKLLIKHGLLNTRSQTVPVKRVQSVTLTWPFLWRIKGWLRVTLAVAGQSSSSQDNGRTETDRLLPVATLAQARDIVPLAVPGADPSGLPFTTVVPRARWIAPLRGRVLEAGLTARFFGAVDGFMTRTLTIVPFERIQSVRITQGPWQRRLGLASVHADIAGGTPITAAHRTLEQAYQWADELERRAFHARSK